MPANGRWDLIRCLMVKIRGTFFIGRYLYSVLPLECLIKKPPVPTKQVAISCNKVKSYNVLLPVCIRSYLISFLRYKFLILDTYRPDLLYSYEQECEDPWLFFETERATPAKIYGETLVQDVSGNLTIFL